jgi:hypothetical protein
MIDEKFKTIERSSEKTARSILRTNVSYDVTCAEARPVTRLPATCNSCATTVIIRRDRQELKEDRREFQRHWR